MKTSNLFLLLLLHYSDSLLQTQFSLTPCETNEDCEDHLNATCSDSFCECNGSKICFGKDRLPVNKLGESCSENEDCNIDSAKCLKNSCQCREGMVPSGDQRKCLQISSGIGDKCTESIQCSARTIDAECRDARCACRQHMHEHDGRCFRDVGFGEICNLTEECSHIPNSVCLNSVCSCAVNFIGNRIGNHSVCLEVAESINSTCRKDIQCNVRLGTGSQCSEGFCQCKDLYQYKKSINRCVRDLILGDFCTFHTDCHQPGGGFSKLECVLGTCVCQSAYKEINGYCVNNKSPKTLSSVKTIIIFLLILKSYFS